MSLSRRDFFKYAGSAGAGVAMGTATLDLRPVAAAATGLKIKEAKVHTSVCPYCSVGCNQLVYSKGDTIIDIEGHPDTPHTLGKLCPKVEPLLTADPAHPGRLRAIGKALNPAKQDDAVPDQGTLMVAIGDLQALKKQDLEAARALQRQVRGQFLTNVKDGFFVVALERKGSTSEYVFIRGE